MAEGIKTTRTGLLSSRKGAAPAEAKKKKGWGPCSLFPYQKLVTHCAPIRKWEHGFKNQRLTLKRRNKHAKQEEIWESMMCFSTVAPPMFTGSNYTPLFSLHLQKQTILCSTQTEATFAWNSQAVLMKLIKTFQRFRRVGFYVESFPHWNYVH